MKKIFALYKRFDGILRLPVYSLAPPQAFTGSLLTGLAVYGLLGFALADAGVDGSIWLRLIPLVYIICGFLMNGYWGACRQGKHEPTVKRGHVPPHITFSVFSPRPRKDR